MITFRNYENTLNISKLINLQLKQFQSWNNFVV